MFLPDNGVKIISSALLHYVRTPVCVLAAVFAVISAVTITLAIREIRNDR